MYKPNQFLLASALICATTVSADAVNEAVDPLTQKLHAEYGQASQQAEWANPWMLVATGDVESPASGDEMLTRIVAQFTRETLDRGGWVNAYLSNSDYSAGNLLLFAEIGEGITVTAGMRTRFPCSRRPELCD